MDLKKKSKDELYREELLEELAIVRERIEILNQNLSFIIEPELIDSCIYELNAVQARYTFILKQVKEKDRLKICE